MGCGKVVPCVIDPFLSRQLRPHQREGVAFMWVGVQGALGLPARAHLRRGWQVAAACAAKHRHAKGLLPAACLLPAGSGVHHGAARAGQARLHPGG
jgi:hypothetical protein